MVTRFQPRLSTNYKMAFSYRFCLFLFLALQLCTLDGVFAVDTTCDPGFYLLNGHTCSYCSAGKYCPGGTLTAMLSCAPGTHSSFKASSCTKCP